jgi:hypothetical protein
MTEAIKTIVFAGVALVIAGAAFFSRPKIEEYKPDEEVGKVMFEKFDDPAKAHSLEIVRYDEALGTIDDFKVAREKSSGAWTIPSHAGYPADAENRMRDAALLLVDLQILGVASEVAGDHALFGVVEPDKERLKVGDEGVGLLVSFEDNKGQDLASLIVGKKVKGQEDQRFVRVAGQDVVYTVKIDPEKLSTKFEEWIEKDLLKLNSWDVENVVIKNYTVTPQSLTTVSLDKKFDLSAKYESAEWKLEELKKYRNGQATTVALAENEELNGDKLNDLKNAVDDLEIVDVRRKPKGLGADLKAGKGFAQDEEGIRDLNVRGFYVVSTPSGQFDTLSENGEVYVGMKEGVEYVLRFGKTLAGSGDESEEGENRYLFVTARVDMAKFPRPEREPLPERPAKKAKSGEDAEDGKQDPAPAEPKAAETSDENGDPKKKEADAGQSAGETAADAGESSESEEGEAKADKDQPTDKEAAEAEYEKEVERIEKDYQRKVDERNEKIDKAREKVAELNTRFADWYYVVSDSQFKKIQLGLDDVIKKKESDTSEDKKDEGEGEDIEDFRTLQEEGLKKD